MVVAVGEVIAIAASLLMTAFFGGSMAQTQMNEEDRRKRDEEIRRQELAYREKVEADNQRQGKLNMVFATAGLVISVLSVALLARAYSGR